MLISTLMSTMGYQYIKGIINILDILNLTKNYTLFVFLSFLVPKLCRFEYYVMYNLPPTILNWHLPPTPAQTKV